MERRVVITGMGVISPLGLSLDEHWEGLRAGRSGVTRITRFDPSPFTSQIGGEVKGFSPEPLISRKEARRLDRFVQYAIVAMEEAVAGARLRETGFDPDRTGIIVGSGVGGIETLTTQHAVLQKSGPGRVSPFFVPMMIADMAPGMMAMRFGAKGPNWAAVSACASSAHAMGEAYRAIRHGTADVMLSGGCEAPICELSFAGFCSMRALSCRNDEPERASRPFDKGRDGFVMAEGAGIVVLEELNHARARGVEILAEVVGYGATADAYHITAPAPNGEGAARAMALALKDGGLKPTDVDYINAHGTSTELNDLTETQAIHTVFGDHSRFLLVSSTKSMIGHLLGAGGVVELVSTVMMLREGWVHPTINLEDPDPRCDLDYVPGSGRDAAIRVAISNSLGFGGHNVALAVRTFE
jgi:3-oxoacyl-[acyl-carrier-protein] synthase II